MLREAKILQNQTIYDLGNLLLGGNGNIYRGLIQLNDYMESIDDDLADFIGRSVVYDDQYYQKPAPGLNQSAPVVPDQYEKVGRDGQSFYDACLMEYGSLDNVMKLIQDSGIVSTAQVDVSGKLLNFSRSSVTNQAIVNVITKKGQVYTTLYDEFATGFSNVRIIESGPDRLIESGQVRIIE